LIPEQEFEFIGLKPEIDEIVWLGTNVTHSLNDNGFTTSVELEVQLPDADDVSTLFEGREEKTEEEKQQTKKRTGKNYADYTGVIAYYSEGGKSVKITSGDQSKPLKLTHVYKSKKTANNAVKREQAKIEKARK
ncbi:TPA: DNA primase, partial [Acinetobacter baumannii]